MRIDRTIDILHGHLRDLHPLFIDNVRANDRRKDVPAVLLSRLNQVISFADKK